MDPKTKITTGANERSRNETIAQTGPGFPDDGRAPPTVDEKDVARVREKLTGRASEGRDLSPLDAANPDRVPEGTEGAGENICRRCSGTGKLDGDACPDCGGTGIVTTPVGGGG